MNQIRVQDMFQSQLLLLWTTARNRGCGRNAKSSLVAKLAEDSRRLVLSATQKHPCMHAGDTGKRSGHRGKPAAWRSLWRRWDRVENHIASKKKKTKEGRKQAIIVYAGWESSVFFGLRIHLIQIWFENRTKGTGESKNWSLTYWGYYSKRRNDWAKLCGLFPRSVESNQTAYGSRNTKNAIIQVDISKAREWKGKIA